MGILVLITVFSVVLGGSAVMSADFESKWLSVRSVGTAVSQEYKGLTFSIDELDGMFVIITVIITFSVLLGIRVLASGLSDSSINIVSVLTAYGGIWLVLSFIARGLIQDIEVFGPLLYITLTIGYTIGIVQKHVGVG